MTNKLFAPGDTVFDIGAHHGESARLFVAGGAGKVVSLEPVLSNYLELCKTALEYPQIVPIHAAAYSMPGVAQVFPSRHADGWSSLLPSKWQEMYPDADWDSPQTVACVTLRSLEDKFGRPSMVKIDVEGAELEVIKAMGDTEVVVFEFHKKFSKDAMDCINLLVERRGFSRGHFDEFDLNLAVDLDLSIVELVDRFNQSDLNWGNIYMR
jgi:FkbM family methyltransferase